MCHSRHRDRDHHVRRSRTWPDETRAGDADRETTLVALRDHAAAGRLDAHELDERLDVALRAQTLGELRGLTTDLPGARPRLGPRPVQQPLPTLQHPLEPCLLVLRVVGLQHTRPHGAAETRRGARGEEV